MHVIPRCWDARNLSEEEGPASTQLKPNHQAQRQTLNLQEQSLPPLCNLQANLFLGQLTVSFHPRPLGKFSLAARCRRLCLCARHCSLLFTFHACFHLPLQTCGFAAILPHRCELEEDALPR